MGSEMCDYLIYYVQIFKGLNQLVKSSGHGTTGTN